ATATTLPTDCSGVSLPLAVSGSGLDSEGREDLLCLPSERSELLIGGEVQVVAALSGGADPETAPSPQLRSHHGMPGPAVPIVRTDIGKDRVPPDEGAHRLGVRVGARAVLERAHRPGDLLDTVRRPAHRSTDPVPGPP